ncbi:hypothetical protein [Streptococcus ovis]|uniref:hypothetical protein n=1 Tax=Streptococcus ovis TaxID=82806 RepID=UPI003CCBC918
MDCERNRTRQGAADRTWRSSKILNDVLTFIQFTICRICLRQQAYQGAIPGLKKASW